MSKYGSPIKARYTDCVGGKSRDAKKCEDTTCPLFTHRRGFTPRGGGSKQKAIRAYCLWCCLDNRYEVDLCPANECSLWPFRSRKIETIGRDSLGMPIKSILMPETPPFLYQNGGEKAVWLPYHHPPLG